MAKALFNRNEVIDNAIRLFWKNGYSASSMSQVVSATGLKPGSIYHAFGNKEGLFKEALQTYAQKGMDNIRTTLETSPGVGSGICTILDRYIRESAQKNYCSCFLVKTQLELAAEGSPLYELASEKLHQIETLYHSYLEQEYDNSRQLAASLMLNIFGMRVYGYRKGSAPLLREGLEQGLPWLPWDKNR
jgi:TetR/AcrR family transcriptional repressor of nem operon